MVLQTNKYLKQKKFKVTVFICKFKIIKSSEESKTVFIFTSAIHLLYIRIHIYKSILILIVFL